MTIIEFLSGLGACSEAVEWAQRYATLDDLWYACPRIEWLLWMLEQIDYHDEPRLRTFAAVCAWRNEALLSEPDSRWAIAVAERAGRNRAAADDLEEARRRAQRAAEAAATRSDWSQARAAAATAAWRAARDSALEAARDVSLHTLRATEWDRETATTRESEEAWQIVLLRSLVADDVPTIKELALRRARQLVS